MGRVLLGVTGGVAAFEDELRIGAIGVSGGSGEQDQSVAEAGAAIAYHVAAHHTVVEARLERLIDHAAVLDAHEDAVPDLVVGEALDVPLDERLEGSLAAVVVGVLKGVSIVRVHQVRATVRAVRMTEAILGRRRPAVTRRGLA